MAYSKRRARFLLALATLITLLIGEAEAFLRAAKEAAEAPSPPSAATTSSGHQAREAIDRHGVHDPANPDRDRLQTIGEATRHLPYDANGFPDWMRALREGLINPRADLKGQEAMNVLDLDVVMKNTREMPHVKFPHRSHTLWLACANCHPAPFKAQAGANEIRMADIFRGNYCGLCHDRVAFITFFSCQRCHSVPQGDKRP